MFRKMPIILLGIIVFLGFIHPWIPLPCKSILYAMSLSIKSIMIFILPYLIFGLIFKTAFHMAKKASKMILFIIALICISNFSSTMISYAVGSFAYQFNFSMAIPHETMQLTPAWIFTLPTWVGNGQAMGIGAILGIILGYLNPPWAARLSQSIETIIRKVFASFLYIVPIFIIGFVIKMYHDETLMQILRNFALIFTIIAISVCAYILLMYFLSTRGQKISFFKSLKNMYPAALAGACSMSSAAAMPLTLIGAEKNTQNPHLPRSLIPATVNIHLIGDCFAIPIFAFAILKNFAMPDPSFSSYLIFACYFVLAKFSVAAVPGGGILIMLPILEHYLGFNAEMLSLITALYILFDPVITCANVMGNGGFCMVVNRFLKRLKFFKNISSN